MGKEVSCSVRRCLQVSRREGGGDMLGSKFARVGGAWHCLQATRIP